MILTACPGEDPPPPERPVIAAFTAMPAMVNAGEMVTLAWSVTGADTIKISANPGGELVANANASGTQMTVVNADTTFTLVATNSAGNSQKTAMVTISTPGGPMIDSFTSSVMMTAPNAEVTLSWQTTNATSVDLSDGATNIVADGMADGTFVVRPDETTTYTLTAKGTGTPATRSVTVTVVLQGPIVSTFTAMPMTVIDGEKATLSWTVMNAVEITIVDNTNTQVYRGNDLTGSVEVFPTVATPPAGALYVLTARDADNLTGTGMVTITVNPVPGPSIDDFSANPTTVNLGEETTLSWTVSDATTIEISDASGVIHTDTNLTGTFDVLPLATTTYSLRAVDANMLEETAMVTVTVNAGPPPILLFEVQPNPLPLSGTTNLSWQTATADAVIILRDGVEIYTTTDNTGTFQTTQTTTVADYLLTVSNALGSNSSTITVYAHALPVINSFTVEPTTLPLSGSVTATITWDVEGAATLDLIANGVAVPTFTRIDVNPMTTSSSGMLILTVSTITDFSLFATSAAGNAVETITVRQLVSKMEPNDTPDVATPYMPGNVVTGSIDPSGDLDWYSVTVPAGGWLRVETSNLAGGCDTTSDTEIAVYNSTIAIDANLIAENDDVGSLQYCSRLTPFNELPTATENLKDLPGGTYYIRVSASSFVPNATFGYLFGADVGSPECGNGLYEPSAMEQCDDQNLNAGDGCDGSCLFEVAPTIITAPGGSVTVTVLPGAFQLVQVNTTAGGQSLAVVAADANGGCDVIDTAIVMTSSTYQVIGQKVDGGPTGTAGNCGAIEYPEDTFAIDLEADTYYMAIFNQGTTPGQATVTVTFTDPVCGNNVLTLNSGEECDDGNVVSGDACSAACAIEIASLPSPTEYTYPGGISALAQHDFIPLTVTAETYVIASVFVPTVAGGCSDDPAIALTDASMTRLSENAGGGVGGACSTVGPNAATRVLPGNYFIEVWDNGDDGIITAYQVVIASRVIDVCGNGVTETNETCDDGNTSAGDGCSPVCQPETAILPAAQPFVFSDGINVVGQRDLLAFTLTQQAYVHAETFVPARGNCTADTVIRLLDANMVELGDDDEDGLFSCSVITPQTDNFALLMPGDYFIEVSDYLDNDTIPAYELVIQAYDLGICGNHFLDPGEICDDGNNVSEDGCDAVCAVVEHTCDFTQTAAVGPQTGNTSTSFHVNDTVCDGYEQPGPEEVWEYLVPTTGMLTIAMQSPADLSVYARSPSCSADFDTIDCQDLGLANATETLSISVTQGELIYIIVDSWSPVAHGPYTLTLTQ